MNRLFGNSGVRLSKWVLSFALSGSSVSTASTLSSAKKRSLSFGGRIWPAIEIAGLQIEPADLRRRNVDVLRARQVIETLRAQEAEAFRQNFQHALGEQHAAAFGVLLQDVENHLVLAHRAEIFDAQVLGHVVQLGHGHRLQLGDVQGSGDDIALAAGLGGRGFFSSPSPRFDGPGGRFQFHRRRGGCGAPAAPLPCRASRRLASSSAIRPWTWPEPWVWRVFWC